jgi:hypothetical protein
MFIRVNDVLVNTSLIQYIEVKCETVHYVNIHFNVGSIKRIKFKNILELNNFLEKLDSEGLSSLKYGEVV